MKLRNKKTWEIMQGLELSVIEYGFGHEWMRDWSYNSIKAFLEDWEDVNENSPTEPLIKDEKIRKAVRAWADVNNIDKATCKEEIHCVTFETERGMFISFEYADPIPPEGDFTIAELCGDDDA